MSTNDDDVSPPLFLDSNGPYSVDMVRSNRPWEQLPAETDESGPKSLLMAEFRVSRVISLALSSSVVVLMGRDAPAAVVMADAADD